MPHHSCLCEKIRRRIDGYTSENDLLKMIDTLSTIIRRSGKRQTDFDRLNATAQAVIYTADRHHEEIGDVVAWLTNGTGPVYLHFSSHGTRYAKQAPWPFIAWAAVDGLVQAGLDVDDNLTTELADRQIRLCRSAEDLTQAVALLARLTAKPSGAAPLQQITEIRPARHNASALLQSIRDQHHA